MSNILSRGVVLATALVCLVVVELQVRAEDKPPEKLALQSGYSGKVLVDGARRISLSVVLDEKGGGSGTLTLDPNIRDGERSTQIAIQEIPIRLRLAQGEGQAGKGRRLYELKRTGPEGQPEEGGERWFLVRPLKEGMPCWLVFADKDGKFQDILVLE
jgi:hypothetical protein